MEEAGEQTFLFLLMPSLQYQSLPTFRVSRNLPSPHYSFLRSKTAEIGTYQPLTRLYTLKIFSWGRGSGGHGGNTTAVPAVLYHRGTNRDLLEFPGENDERMGPVLLPAIVRATTRHRFALFMPKSGCGHIVVASVVVGIDLPSLISRCIISK